MITNWRGPRPDILKVSFSLFFSSFFFLFFSPFSFLSLSLSLSGALLAPGPTICPTMPSSRYATGYGPWDYAVRGNWVSSKKKCYRCCGWFLTRKIIFKNSERKYFSLRQRGSGTAPCTPPPDKKLNDVYLSINLVWVFDSLTKKGNDIPYLRPIKYQILGKGSLAPCNHLQSVFVWNLEIDSSGLFN